MRSQANLPALAVALLALTAATALSLAVADGAFASADRDPGERRVAVALSERLVGPAGPLAVRRNVLDGSYAESLTATELDRSYPIARGHDVRLRLGDRLHVERGDPTGGTTITRVVLVADRQAVTVRPTLPGNEITLPRRTSRIDLHVDPPPGANVTTVRADERVVLRNATGLRGNFTVGVSRYETVRLAFETNGHRLPQGSVVVTYYPVETSKATLEVTVDE